MEFFDRYFHIPLPIVTKHKLGLPFPPRNLRIKFGANPSMVTDRHTDTYKPTPVKTYFLAFAGIKSKKITVIKNKATHESTNKIMDVHTYLEVHWCLSMAL